MTSLSTSKSSVNRPRKTQKMQKLIPTWGWCRNCLKYICDGAKAKNTVNAIAELLLKKGHHFLPLPAATEEGSMIKGLEKALEIRSEIFVEIMEELLNAEKESKMIIGVYGMAGVGKTILVGQVAQKAMKEGLFDEVFMAVATPSSDIRLQLQEKKKKINNALKRENHRVLVITDNIWKPIDLKEDLGISASVDNEQHKGFVAVVITSRSQDVLREMSTRKDFLVEPLLKNEGLHLLRHFFGNDDDSNAYQLDNKSEIEIVNKCAGLPLALVQMAQGLRHLTSTKWEHVWNEPGIGSFMYSSINLSFQNLESEEMRKIFLLCALFGGSEISYEQILTYVVGENDPKAFANMRMEDIRSEVYKKLDSLKRSGLLLNSETIDSATMNSLFLDFAITVANENHMLVATNEVGREEWLLMDENGMRDLTHISLLSHASEGAFHHCRKLRVLLSKYSTKSYLSISKEIRVLDHVGKPLDGSLYGLKYIQTLNFKDCGDLDTTEIAKIQELKSLKILSFTGTTDIHELPKEIVNLTNLCSLDLRCHSVGIITREVFEEMTQLQELYMGNFFYWWDYLLRFRESRELIPSSSHLFWELQSHHLTAEELELESHHISTKRELESRHLRSYAEFEDLRHLTTLEIHVPTVELFFGEFSIFQKLVRFKINVGCHDSEWQGKDKTSTIKKFKVKRPVSTWSWSDIWTRRSRNCFLQVLLIAQGLWLDEMSQLKNLDMILIISKRGKHFSELKHLHIQHNTEMDCITSGKISFPVLESLVVKNSRLCRTFSDETSFSNLRDLQIEGCHGLDFVLNEQVAARLAKLEEMKISECERMEAIFVGDSRDDVIIQFPHLRKLTLQYLPKLKAFFSGSLQESTTSHGLVDAAINTQAEQLWPFEIELPSLVYLKLAKTPNISRHQLSLICSNLKNQKVLDISDCSLLEELSETKLNAKIEPKMHKLQELCLINLPQLKTIVNEVELRNVKLKMLKQLTVCNCKSLTYLFSYDMALSLVEVQKIEIRNCDELLEIVRRGEVTIAGTNQHVIGFPFLKSLKLLSLPNLARICSEVRFLKCSWLKELKINDCPKLHFGFTNKDEQETSSDQRSLEVDSIEVLAPFLEEVRFRQLAHLKFMIFKPRNLQKLNLSILQVHGCSNLINLFSQSGAQSLQFLQELWITSCYSIKEIVTEESGEAAINDKIVFPKVKTLVLKDLAELVSFGPGNCIVEWPSLKNLTIRGCPKIRSIGLGVTDRWKLQAVDIDSKDSLLSFFKLPDTFKTVKEYKIDEQEQLEKIITLGLHPSDFCQLEQLEAKNCDPMLNQFMTILLKRSDLLQHLTIKDCEKLKLVFDIDDNKEKDDMFFKQLKTMTLSNLPSLICIWNIKDSRGISGLHKIQNLEIIECNYLKNLISSDFVLENLRQLQVLKIHSCGNIEQIIALETDAKEAKKRIIEFPKLEFLELVGLSKFTKLHSGNFDFQFPQLKGLEIENCPQMIAFTLGFLGVKEPNETLHGPQHMLGIEKAVYPKIQKLKLSSVSKIQDIWTKQIPPKSFIELHELELNNCGQLINIIPSDMPNGLFHNLQILTLRACNFMKYLFLPLINGSFMLRTIEISNCEALEKIYVEEEGELSGKILHSHLDSVVIENLPKLSSFSLGTSEFPSLMKLIINCPMLKTFFSGMNGVKDLPKASSDFFINSMSLEKLKELKMTNLHSVEKLWHNRLPSLSFCELEILILSKIHNLLNVIPSNMVERFKNLRKISVEGCDQLQEMFDLEENVLDNCANEMLPELGELILIDLPNLRHVWNNNKAQAVLVFKNLKLLEIINCKRLTELFSLSTASHLQQLELLKLHDCENMEHVLVENIDKTTKSITFPKMECLILSKLSRLESFCPLRCTFDWPKLQIVRVSQTPSMEMFSPGIQNTPMLRAVYVTHLKKHWQGDLNSTIRYIHKNAGKFLPPIPT